MRRIVDMYAQSADEMEQMQRQAASDIDRRIEEANRGLAEKGKDKALEYAGTQGLNYVLAAETGPLLSIGIKVIDHGGRAIIADINEDQLGEQIRAERRHRVKAMEVVAKLCWNDSARPKRSGSGTWRTSSSSSAPTSTRWQRPGSSSTDSRETRTVTRTSIA
jgi:hypothetical protein